ncbi:hypothetical protein ACFQ9Z_15165 [Streptomyces sp. NPDC056580]|uniref:hypothetical protein n=1 Tax=Streptomyces sp. NPDC056580 TaxID=3345872 RepID=UPI0036896E3B
MRPPRHTAWGALLAATAVIAPAAPASAVTTDLGTLPGGRQSSATGVNSEGLTVGWARLSANATYATRWDPQGAISRLTSPKGSTGSEALAVDDAGVIVGDATGSDGQEPVRWNADGTVTRLGAPPGGKGGVAQAVSGNCFIAGLTYDATSGLRRAARWSPDGSATVLPSLPGDRQAWALGVNSSGVAVGVPQSRPPPAPGAVEPGRHGAGTARAARRHRRPGQRPQRQR